MADKINAKFVQSAKFIQAHSGKRGAIAVYGQEANADTWKMAKMNMVIHGTRRNFWMMCDGSMESQRQGMPTMKRKWKKLKESGDEGSTIGYM